MATSFLQRTRERKIMYFGAIVILFTLSLIHREFYIIPQAKAMQLRESVKGEADLTTSAVRVMLTGSRGLATTALWYNAMEKQKRNEWTELKLLVTSITKLQPYFITPWLYQSWNISFNVAVEFDRPHDKYECISEGILMLAEGERRNRGAGDEAAADDPSRIVFPGHPELRHFLGFYYQLKIGTSDERLTMRSLLEMSCIDPLERDPRQFWRVNERNEKSVKLKEFADFVQKHPRLIRRLREQLLYSRPEDVLRFLEMHQDIPSRFKPNTVLTVERSELRDPHRQFPVLPPHEGDSPDPRREDLTPESVDVFLVCRAWYRYAQKPLPPANRLPGITDPDYDKMRYRMPKQMMPQLFRGYPARAQVYIAETLESEGFFDQTGWTVTGWFDRLAGKEGSGILNSDNELEVGTAPKYHSRLAWARGYDAYKEYGEENGIYFTPAFTAELNRKAELARTELKLQPGQIPPQRPAGWSQGEKKDSLDAHIRLHWSQFYRSVSNFDSFFYQSEGEKSPITILARKLLFEAERKRRADPPSEPLLQLYERAWPIYVRASLEHPKFAQVGSMQEDVYEIHQRYLRIAQDARRPRFTNSALWFAEHAFAPMTTWPEMFGRVLAVREAEKERQKVIPFMNRRGPLDAVQYYDGPEARELRQALFLWTQGAQMTAGFHAGATAPHIAAAAGNHLYFLTRADQPWDEPVAPWRGLVDESTRRVVAERPGMKR